MKEIVRVGNFPYFRSRNRNVGYKSSEVKKKLAGITNIFKTKQSTYISRFPRFRAAVSE